MFEKKNEKKSVIKSEKVLHFTKKNHELQTQKKIKTGFTLEKKGDHKNRKKKEFFSAGSISSKNTEIFGKMTCFLGNLQIPQKVISKTVLCGQEK